MQRWPDHILVSDIERAFVCMASGMRCETLSTRSPGPWLGLSGRDRLLTRSEARRAAMGAAGLRIRKRRLHRLPRAEA